MSDLCIPKGGVVDQRWYISGTVLNNAYCRIHGYTHPGAGSPYLFDWTTSGGQILFTGSTVSGAVVRLFVNTSGTSGLDFSMGVYQLSVWHNSGTGLGSVIKFYDAGRVDLVPYSVGGL